MIFDSDVLIWCLRGDLKAGQIIQSSEARSTTLICYLELVQGARDKRSLANIKSFLDQLEFTVHPLTDGVGRRAAELMEEHTLKSGLQLADALIAATALEVGESLCTGNYKHFRGIKELELKHFLPA